MMKCLVNVNRQNATKLLDFARERNINVKEHYLFYSNTDYPFNGDQFGWGNGVGSRDPIFTVDQFIATFSKGMGYTDVKVSRRRLLTI